MAVEILKSRIRELADSRKSESMIRFYKGDDRETVALGVPIERVIAIARDHRDLTTVEIEELLDNRHYEIRIAAVTVMDLKARHKSAPNSDRLTLYRLYLRRHDRIDNWDLVDRAAPGVVGEYLVDKDRSVLTRLARSSNSNERRTAIVSTLAFLAREQTSDTFRLAEILAGDENPNVASAVEHCLREAGRKNEHQLAEFLQKHQHELGHETVSHASILLPKSLQDKSRSSIAC